MSQLSYQLQNVLKAVRKDLAIEQSMTEKLHNELTIALEQAAKDAETIKVLRDLVSKKGVQDA